MVENSEVKDSVQPGKKPGVAVATALKRFPDNEPGSPYEGDFVAPMIRDIGLCMAMGDTPADLMTAQMGKIDSVMNGGIEGAGGRDLHGGCFHRGVLPPTAPLPIASVTMTGMALSSWKKGQDRFHVACVLVKGPHLQENGGRHSIWLLPEGCLYPTFYRIIKLHLTHLQ